MKTDLAKAFDFSWKHDEDLMYHVENRNLSIVSKVATRMSDCIVYLFASMLGINSLEKVARGRISDETVDAYTAFVKSRTDIPVKNESMILILNGDYEVPVSPEGYQQLEKQSNCKIKCVRIRDLNEIGKTFDSIINDNNIIKALWIRAHGTPLSISFTSRAQIDVGPLTELEHMMGSKRIEKGQSLLQEQFKKLEADAPIILESSHTGQEIKAENIAQFIFRAAGGRKVYAPTGPALAIDKGVSYHEGFKVKIKSTQSSTTFPEGSCLARMSAIWHAFCKHEEEITRTFN